MMGAASRAEAASSLLELASSRAAALSPDPGSGPPGSAPALGDAPDPGAPVEVAPGDISRIDASGRAALADYIRRAALSPEDYLSAKIAHKRLVLLGEWHQDARMLAFISENMGRFYQAGLRVVAMEVIRSESSEKATRLVQAPAFDRAAQLELAREGPWLVWNLKEQWDLLKAIWRVNAALPAQAPKLRVEGLEDGRIVYPYLYYYLNQNIPMTPQEREQAQLAGALAQGRDDYMYQRVAELVDGGERVLAIAGDAHTAGFGNRMGGKLRERYQDRMFEVTLHFPEGAADPARPSSFTSFMEGLFQAAGLPRGGFDVSGGPLAGLQDANARDLHPPLEFGDLAGGYLYLGKVARAPKGRRMKNFVTEETFQRWKKYFQGLGASAGRRIDTVADFNDFLHSTKVVP